MKTEHINLNGGILMEASNIIDDSAGSNHSEELPLLPHHLTMLAEESGISLDIIKARGYRSIHGPGVYAELKALGFNKAQSRLAPGLLIPILDIDGKPVLYQFRPDTPRVNKDGKPIRYETPAGAAMRLDFGTVPREQLADPAIKVLFTEGAKKQDGGTTHGLCVVSLPGVWGFKGKNAFGGVSILADFDNLPLKGRDAVLAFDSDISRKRPVQQALERFTVHLQRKGAHVGTVYFPEEDGQKVGLDDYLRKHSVQDLERLIEAPRPTPAAAKPKMELLAAPPKAITRPLSLIGGRAYGAAWLWTRTTITEQLNKDKEVVKVEPPEVREERHLFIIRDDGVIFADVNDPKIKPLEELGLTIHLPEVPPDSRLWSTRGVVAYRGGDRPDPVELFKKLVAVVTRFMDFKRSLASQEAMCELVACFIISTYTLEAFNVIGYLWPNGDKGAGKTTFLHTVCELAYLAQVILAAGSYASLRDLADYGACLAFDDAETVMDKKRGDPDKRMLLLAGNRRGSQVTVREPASDKTWRTRYVNTFCPKLFSAIRLPDDVLGSRTITIPLVRSIDDHRAKAEPLDHELWPHDRTALVDDLWALALANLATLRKFDGKAAQEARLSGRNLEPWRAILAVASWLDSHDAAGELQRAYHDPLRKNGENGENGETANDEDERNNAIGGLFARLEALSVAYQEERSDLEAQDPTRLLIVALREMAAGLPDGVSPFLEFETAEVVKRINQHAQENEITNDGEDFTNTRRLGWLLKRMRFQKATKGKTRHRWKVKVEDITALARAYGMAFSSEKNGDRPTA